MILLEDLTIVSGDFQLEGICLEVKQGECVALMGQSGSGKTTIMEAICGLRETLAGNLFLNGVDHTHSLPEHRNVGLVPQENVLFPKMKVRDQLGYSLRVKKWKTAEIKDRVREVAEQLALTELLDRTPEALSGGEAKRVAIGRAIASKPALLCLDESFTGLDDVARLQVMEVLKSIIAKEKISTLFITHHQEEANSLADRQYRMSEF